MGGINVPVRPPEKKRKSPATHPRKDKAEPSQPTLPPSSKKSSSQPNTATRDEPEPDADHSDSEASLGVEIIIVVAVAFTIFAIVAAILLCCCNSARDPYDPDIEQGVSP